jgi:uncharacterized protein YdaU (DUF1376 family)
MNRQNPIAGKRCYNNGVLAESRATAAQAHRRKSGEGRKSSAHSAEKSKNFDEQTIEKEIPPT